MLQREFELYLSLLGRFLRLRAEQRGEIADELRDHLEDRFHDLVARGLPHEEAVRRALEEFGDAASLAEHFTQLARNRKRRTIMRCTLGTIGLTAAAILVATALWPSNLPLRGPAAALAGPGDKTDGAPHDARSAEVERLLDTTLLTVDFGETPLADALEHLAETMNVDIIIQPVYDKNQPITLVAMRKPVSARTALELALEQVDASASYEIRDGLIVVTNQGPACEIRVYDCNHLLPAATKKPASETRPDTNSIDGLIDVITATIRPETWVAAGGLASIQAFDGMLVVKQSQPAHREIHALLEMLRAHRRE